jgi:hypothetical protein
MREDRDIGFSRELAGAIERDRLERREILVQQRIGLSEYRRDAGEEQATRWRLTPSTSRIAPIT